MKRFHVHAHVDDLPTNIAFYTKLFGEQPARIESDYAKWMLEDPRINFAISTPGARLGIDHLGIQTDTEAELTEMKSQALAAEVALHGEGEATCCYSRSEKYWVTDPQGVAWEQFHTLASIPVFGDERPAATGSPACCSPAATSGKPVPVAVCGTKIGSCC